MSQTVNNPVQITLPAEQAERLQRDATAMGLSLPAYLTFLEQCKSGKLDAKAQDAARFMLSKHGDSLRKLAQ
jgi:branched-subunit amino acid aminotransferase/4-amino-4-deoxychorismate lyase